MALALPARASVMVQGQLRIKHAQSTLQDHVDSLPAQQLMTISFKGTRYGVAITLGDEDWRQTMTELAFQLACPQTRTFFRGARVLLETGPRTIDAAQLEELIALLSQNHMTLSSVSGKRRSQEAFAPMSQSLTPPTTRPEEGVLFSITHSKTESPTNRLSALLLERTVRSGQCYRYVGTIIVIGDVNPGAELVAEGDVIVWGKLRGMVRAGATGNEHASVGALVLAPTQLRIGSYIARAPDLSHRRTHAHAAEVARVRDGNIVVEPWNE